VTAEIEDTVPIAAFLAGLHTAWQLGEVRPTTQTRPNKKNFAATLKAHLAHIPKRKSIEMWFQERLASARNGLVRQWARRGTRPRQPADHRYQSAYLFGAICPARGVGAALAMPFANTQAMQAHLDEIGRTVARGAHAVLLLDRAGWHTTEKLTSPKNLTMILLPSRSPELNPVENIWQFLRANWLSNRVFETYDEIIAAACEAWNKLTALPETITSIGMRDWAHIGHS
jgi:transposase